MTFGRGGEGGERKFEACKIIMIKLPMICSDDSCFFIMKMQAFSASDFFLGTSFTG